MQCVCAQCIDSCKTSSAVDFIVPGFNDHVKTLHTEALQCIYHLERYGKAQSCGDVLPNAKHSSFI